MRQTTFPVISLKPLPVSEALKSSCVAKSFYSISGAFREGQVPQSFVREA